MNARDYLRLLARHWALIAVCVLVSCSVAAGLAMIQTSKYESHAQFFVSTGSEDATTINGDAFSQQRMKSYAGVLESPLVLDAVVKQLNLPYTAGELEDRITVSVPLDTVLIEYSVTDESADRATQIANAVAQRFPEVVADLDSAPGGAAVQVTVTEPPSFSEMPVSPNTTRYLALGLLIGLALGVALALLRGALDSKVRTRESLGEVTDTPVLGEIPGGREPGSVTLAYRQLSTALWALQDDRKRLAIAVTSPRDEEARSGVAERTALALAEVGERVLLIRANSTRSSRDKGDSQVGLSDVLRNDVPLETALRTIQIDDDTAVTVMPSGSAPLNATNLYGSRRMRDLLGALRDDFPIVVVEAPPLLTTAEAGALAASTDGVVLFVEASRTTEDELSASLELLDTVSAPVLGLVLGDRPRISSRPKSSGQRVRRPEPVG